MKSGNSLEGSGLCRTGFLAFLRANWLAENVFAPPRAERHALLEQLGRYDSATRSYSYSILESPISISGYPRDTPAEGSLATMPVRRVRRIWELRNVANNRYPA